MDALLTPWKLTMLPLLLLFVWQWLNDDTDMRGAKLRTWAALYVSSVLGWWMTPATGETPYLIYIILCVGAAAVTLRDWKGEAQHAIGLLFGAMALVHFGGMMAGRPDPGQLYHGVLVFGGWLQLAILVVWGAVDAGLGKILRRIRDRVRPPRYIWWRITTPSRERMRDRD